jgi:hypothetical protein
VSAPGQPWRPVPAHLCAGCRPTLTEPPNDRRSIRSKLLRSRASTELVADPRPAAVVEGGIDQQRHASVGLALMVWPLTQWLSDVYSDGTTTRNADSSAGLANRLNCRAPARQLIDREKGQRTACPGFCSPAQAARRLSISAARARPPDRASPTRAQSLCPRNSAWRSRGSRSCAPRATGNSSRPTHQGLRPAMATAHQVLAPMIGASRAHLPPLRPAARRPQNRPRSHNAQICAAAGPQTGLVPHAPGCPSPRATAAPSPPLTPRPLSESSTTGGQSTGAIGCGRYDQALQEQTSRT